MVDAIVSPLLQQLISFAAQEVTQPVKLVTGVEQEVKKLTSHLQAIRAVIDDAEERQVKDKAVKLWLDRLKEASCDIEDVLDEWITARRKMEMKENGHASQKQVCSCIPASSIGFKKIILRHDIAVKIKEINKKIDAVATEKDMFKFVENGSNSTRERPGRVQSTSLIDEEEICGRVGEKNELLSKLLCESSDQEKVFHIISIVGMGGMGKTTLAQVACNNDEVKRKFDKILWVCVSDNFEEFRVAKAIIEALGGSASSLAEFQSLLKTIYESITEKRFLLVLDDVWDGDYIKWQPFFCFLKNGLRESKILITTRKESVASMMGSTYIIAVKELAEEECWSLFKRLAIFGRSIEKCEKIEQVGRKLVRKCKGLPLAAKILGSLMRSKKTVEEWERILNSEFWKIEEIEKGLLAPLLLSYNDLPAKVKRCFSYCAVFPKDYSIEKEDLITLWMAQGYLKVEEEEEMETIGEDYLAILSTHSFFHEFVKDDDNNIIRCKMHDIIHDFAQFLSQNECMSIEINGGEESTINCLGEKVCHLMFNLGWNGASFPDVSACRVTRLRSLLIRGRNVDYSLCSTTFLQELFGELSCLRALDFGDGWLASNLIKEIPANVEKLIHLRYLNMFGQSMEKLPKTLCELYNLQYLNVSYCMNLTELPLGIGKLINLRHLLNHGTRSLRYMPAGIARLTGLRRLKKLVVNEVFDGSKASRLDSLKSLDHLRECGISGLGNVSDVGEAKRSQLYKKKNLISLSLWFDSEEEGGSRKSTDDEQLLEVLQPAPLNLKELLIVSYRGKAVSPKWMMSLTNLRSLTLDKCKNCEQLPPLGRLPSLGKLFISELECVKRVGNEFLGIESDSDPSSSSSSSVIAFPKLKSLTIWTMEELEEWDYRITGNIFIMPCLSSLQIFICGKLKALPDHFHQTTTLKELRILLCDILEERYRKGRGEDWPKISHIPNVII